MTFLDLDDCRLKYSQRGEGPDIVWIPGGDQSGDCYNELLDLMGDGFRHTTFDPRGAGQTETASQPPWPISTMAQDCAELISQVCEPPVVLVGLSLGALIVQEVTLSEPDLVRIAIPMGTGAKKSGFFYEWEETEILFAEAGNRLPSDLALIHYAAFCYPAEVLGSDELWQKCKSYLEMTSVDRDQRMMAAQWRACLEYDSTTRLPDCQVPMHVVAFEQDLQTPPARGKLVADLAGNGHFHVLPGMGHFSMFGHKPEAVCDLIKSILKAA